LFKHHLEADASDEIKTWSRTNGEK